MKSLREKWDKKAQNYNRYTADDTVLEAIICRKIEEAGIDLRGKRILDIGCGTGAYTLCFAQKAAHVDALDISPEMLRILNEDAHSIALDTITTHQTTWEDYPLPSTPYDIATATMFPALKKDPHFQKMHDAAHTKIFLGWGGKRGTALIEALLAIHGGSYTPPNSATILKYWLDTHQLPYRLLEHTEKKIRVKPFNQAIDNYTWHLKVRGMEPDKAKITSVLTQHLNTDGDVVERALNYFHLIIW